MDAKTLLILLLIVGVGVLGYLYYDSQQHGVSHRYSQASRSRRSSAPAVASCAGHAPARRRRARQYGVNPVPRMQWRAAGACSTMLQAPRRAP